MPNSAQSAPGAPADTAANAPAEAGAGTSNRASVPERKPQLIKKAQLSLVVESIDSSIESVSAIAQQQQGDVLGLQSTKPTRSDTRPEASMQVRVPQDRLEPTITAIARLGTVQSRSITAEDVSSQLVDYQARLRNLRRSEEAVLKIMERSGSVGDVLKVAQELSNIRQSIEQIDAQIKSLQNQVAYSTITLNLEQAIASAPPPGLAVGRQIQETWSQSTHSVRGFSVGMLKLVIWLLVYSPYWLVLGGAIYWFSRHRKRKVLPPPSVSNPPASGS